MINSKEKLKKLKINDKVIKEIVKNAALKEKLINLIDKLDIDQIDKKAGNLIYDIGSSSKIKDEHKERLGRYVLEGKIVSKIQILEYLNYMKEEVDFDFQDAKLGSFEESIGVGVNYTEEEINDFVENFVDENIDKISVNPFDKTLMNSLRSEMKFACQKTLIKLYNEHTKKYKGKKSKKKEKKKKQAHVEGVAMDDDQADELVRSYKIKKLIARDMMESLNSKKHIEAHRERTKGLIITRFPPEPNGYLHIGHCKAMRFNFKVAQDHGGYTNLRFDDTNPEKESLEFIDKIIEGVRWMGYTPKQILYASDYFPQIYNYAVELIKKGKAFVCHLNQEDGKALREDRKPSPYRDRPIEENIREFELMKAGFYEEGDCVLRAKIDYKHPNPTMRDPVIYRIMYVAHPHIGDKWCIYPLYDFVHSISDSIEDITHSLCTLEFEIRRDIYYWSLNELDLYKPYVWEYSRLNLSNNVLSKRKLIKMVQGKIVDGWDDPRLLTLDGMKRRGYPAEAINYFCDLISVTRRGNSNVLNFQLFEYYMRKNLNPISSHAFCVFDPIEVVIKNLSEEMVLSPDNFKYKLNVSNSVYVDRNDVKQEDDPKFYGMAPNKIVRLRFGPFLKVLSVGPNQVVAEIVEVADFKKIKGNLHWVDVNNALTCEVREYSVPFKTKFPGKDTGNFLDDFDHDSKQIYQNAKISRNILESLSVEDKLQFERKGYYSLDYDTDLKIKKLVFNQIVSLKKKKI